MTASVRYARNKDGQSVAYQVTGEGPPDIVFIRISDPSKLAIRTSLLATLQLAVSPTLSTYTFPLAALRRSERATQPRRTVPDAVLISAS